VVVRHPALQLVVKLVDMTLPDADDRGPHLGQRAHEVSLRRRERRFDEDHVHGSGG
jgi:hypothetical protein